MTLAPTKADVQSCIGKTRWASERAARRALTNIRARSEGKMRDSVRPYRCRVCWRWHLGGEF